MDRKTAAQEIFGFTKKLQERKDRKAAEKAARDARDSFFRDVDELVYSNIAILIRDLDRALGPARPAKVEENSDDARFEHMVCGFASRVLTTLRECKALEDFAGRVAKLGQERGLDITKESVAAMMDEDFMLDPNGTEAIREKTTTQLVFCFDCPSVMGKKCHDALGKGLVYIFRKRIYGCEIESSSDVDFCNVDVFIPLKDPAW